MPKHFNIDAIRKEAKKMNKKIIQRESEIKDKDISEYNDTSFNLLTITLHFGLSIDDTRAILLEKLQDDDPRKDEIWKNMKSDNMKQRLIYPGGYKAFVNDVKNNYFPTISPDMLS